MLRPLHSLHCIQLLAQAMSLILSAVLNDVRNLPARLLALGFCRRMLEHQLTVSVVMQIKKHLPGTEEHKAHKANQDSGMGGMSGTGAGTNQY